MGMSSLKLPRLEGIWKHLKCFKYRESVHYNGRRPKEMGEYFTMVFDNSVLLELSHLTITVQKDRLLFYSFDHRGN